MHRLEAGDVSDYEYNLPGKEERLELKKERDNREKLENEKESPIGNAFGCLFIVFCFGLIGGFLWLLNLIAAQL